MSETLEKQLTDFKHACREAGLRLTHQRLEVYREVALATDHPTAEALYQRLHDAFPMMSLDTIYRTLTTFVKHGLIKKVDTIESLARFEVTDKQHHHLICSRCREIMDFQWTTIDDTPLPIETASWGRVDNKNVVVYGVCNKCLS